MWKCSSCGQRINPPARYCPRCKYRTDIPSNVALAGEDEEHLKQRFEDCLQNCEECQKDLIFEYMRTLKNNISISINVHPPSLVNILQDERIRLVNLHDNLRANAMINYDKDLIAKRKGLDNLVFEVDGDKLNFGAVNLGNIGLVSYGAACVFLKSDDKLKKNASFLENNLFNYIKYSLPAIDLRIPFGVRSLWHTVHKLAVVKHESDFLNSKKLTYPELTNLILSSDGNKNNDRFIEAQIYPPITRSSISKITLSRSHCRSIKANGLVGKTAEHSKNILREYAESYSQMISSQLKLHLPDVTFEEIE